MSPWSPKVVSPQRDQVDHANWKRQQKNLAGHDRPKEDVSRRNATVLMCGWKSQGWNQFDSVYPDQNGL